MLYALAVLLLGVAATYGYGVWHAHRTQQFKDGCVAATRRQEWKRLGLISDKWVAWDPSSDDAHVYRAESQFQAGQLAEAAESLGQVSNDYHGAVSALSFRGEILYGDLHQPYEAEAAWQRILEIDSESTHAHQRLISFYAMSLQRDKMVQQIRESLQHQCEPPEAYSYLLLANALGFTEGLTLVQKWRENLPDDETLKVAEAIYAAKYPKEPTITSAFEKSYLAPGDQTAIDVCLKDYPQNIEVLAYHIDRLMYYGKTARVVELLQSAPREAMQDSRFWRYRGWLLKQTEDYPRALDALQKSIAMDPFGWRSRWEAATLLRQTGHEEDAEAMQELAMTGKVLQDSLYRTNGRELTWGLVEEIRDYIARVDEPMVLAALESRIRRQGGDAVAAELLQDSGLPAEENGSSGL